MVDAKTFDMLSGLSKFDFTDESQMRFTDDLNAIIGFVDKVREFDGEYDDTAENRRVSYPDLREDAVIETATSKQLLSNTNSENNCYIIPKVID